jgi:hypothetical protein
MRLKNVLKEVKYGARARLKVLLVSLVSQNLVLNNVSSYTNAIPSVRVDIYIQSLGHSLAGII